MPPLSHCYIKHTMAQALNKLDKLKNPIFDFFEKEKYLAQNLGHFAPSKKGLNKIGPTIALQ